MLRDLVLFFAGMGCAGMGLVNPGTAPIWFVLAAVCGLAIVIREGRNHWSGWLWSRSHPQRASSVEPTDEAVEKLAELLLARWQDAEDNLGISSSPLGIRQARWHARERLRKEMRAAEKTRERKTDSN
jgi:hypothetical protein